MVARPGEDVTKAALVGVTALLLGVVALLVVWQLRYVLIIAFAGVALAAAITPITDFLRRWHVPTWLAMLLAYTTFFVAIPVALGLVLLPPLVRQFLALGVLVPEYLDRAQQLLEDLVETAAFYGIEVSPQDAFSAVGQYAATIAQFLLRLPFGLATIVIGLATAFLVSIYWLAAQRRGKRLLLSVVPLSWRDTADVVVAEMGTRLGGYVRGVAVTGVVVAVLAYIGLRVLGVQQALVLAVIAGFGELIPVLGPWLAGIPAVLVALLTSPLQALGVVLLYVVIQQIESYVVAPYVMGRAMSVHPIVVVLALLSGGTLLGLLGVILAVPFVAVVSAPIELVVIPAMRRWAQVR